ncbi:DUF6973 domain-containing protein [Actinoplanes sp. G11-F43]|uniref:WXG100 family type VII secretion target n=1 Tax=Actinoplanes sp. G11-F43 TaxID=3424130 RepID=UPI003D353939
MTTFRDQVFYIEEMRPEYTAMAAEDFQRVARVIESGLPELDGLVGTVEWEGEAAERYETRLGQAVDIATKLGIGYRRAGTALENYRSAQQSAKDLVNTGIVLERRLGELIAPLTAAHAGLSAAGPMAQWDFLVGPSALGGPEIDERREAVRDEADYLFREADGCYTRAIPTEGDARVKVLDAVRAARDLLPDLLADSGNTARVIATAPGLREEVFQAAKLDPDARKPGEQILNEYQVAADGPKQRYPSGGLLLDLGVVEPQEVTPSEARILRGMPLADQIAFHDIRKTAIDTANAQFPEDIQNGHTDAFRHAYWNALLTAKFGVDFAREMTTAHEAVPDHTAADEAMDLHNNEVGRQIAVANRGASPEELAVLIREAVDSGRTVVVDKAGDLAYSDQVARGDTGDPRPIQRPGRPQDDVGY